MYLSHMTLVINIFFFTWLNAGIIIRYTVQRTRWTVTSISNSSHMEFEPHISRLSSLRCFSAIYRGIFTWAECRCFKMDNDVFLLRRYLLIHDCYINTAAHWASQNNNHEVPPLMRCRREHYRLSYLFSMCSIQSLFILHALQKWQTSSHICAACGIWGSHSRASLVGCCAVSLDKLPTFRRGLVNSSLGPRNPKRVTRLLTSAAPLLQEMYSHIGAYVFLWNPNSMWAITLCVCVCVCVCVRPTYGLLFAATETCRHWNA
jgi:hypothetical protein